jgi:predicted small secreted protein
LNRMKYPKTLIGLLLLGSVLLSACGAGEPDITATPTVSVEYIQTMAVAEFASGLTQTAIAMPTNTPTLTPSPTMTNTPIPTVTAGTPASFGVAPTASCYALSFVADINIPDNTPLKPGESFTKTWKVKNTGTCAWDAGFKLNFTGGDAMGGTAFVLSKVVSPGAEAEISVPMIAPATTGTIRGNWRMSTATGTYFGDEIYLIILVAGGTSSTSTPEPPTATPSP